MRYEADADPGVHGAAEWVLRKRGFDAQREAAGRRPAGKPAGDKGWFVTPKLHTMILARPPGRFIIGSPDDEPGHDHLGFRIARTLRERGVDSARERRL
jgi:hypothetical protein